jgi:hypothetical protein
MDERAERIGRNEDLFRKVNDQIEGVNEAFGTITGTMSILCECGQLACIEEIPDVEQIVAWNEGYFVVEKTKGDAARLAKDLA